MRVLTFVSTNPAHASAFKWLYVAFNVTATHGTPEQVRKNLDILDKFHAVSVDDETSPPFPWMENARVLKSGRLELSEGEFAQLETAIGKIEERLQPIAIVTHARPAAAFLRSATREKADRASSGGPGPRAVTRKGD